MDEKMLLEAIKRNKNTFRTDKMDFSFGELMTMYLSEELIIDPNYQRLFRWSEFQQTLFLESIILGIPIPPIFVAENEEGKWELVDGLQRMSTIISFFGELQTFPEKNAWKLKKGRLVPELEGYDYSTLPTKLSLNIKRSGCRVEIISSESELDMRFELFNRLNTGGSILTEQEIRNCIFRGYKSEFYDMLGEISNNETFLRLVNLTKRKISERYHEDLALRVIALLDGWEDIDIPLGQFLTAYLKDSVKNENYNTTEKKDTFFRILRVIIRIDNVFKGKNNQFSASYFEVIMLIIGKNLEVFESMEQKEIIEFIDAIKTSDDFADKMGSSASASSRVLKRIEIVQEIFDRMFPG